jgi:uncharacterized protein (TIGR02145 family)
MKKIILLLTLTSALFSCKKATTTPNTTPKNTSDTTKVVNDTTKTSNDAIISGFDCVGVKITGTLVKNKVVSNVSAKIDYIGGNGKTYLTKAHTSTGVTGLSATLLAGTLANGEGTLVYTISGTPTTAGTANFSIALGGKSCTVSVKVEDVSQSNGINFNSIGTQIGSFQNNVSDVDGNTYKTVTIGIQTWMAENLKTSKYNDGTTIPNITDNSQWFNLTTGAWAYYNNDAANNAKYGKLYNWYTVNQTTNGYKNVCPTGWHVPTDVEWTVLTDYLGGKIIAGGKMKEVDTTNWKVLNTDATNTSLFTGLPGGYRYGSGGYFGIDYGGFWWSITRNDVYRAWSRDLGGGGGSVGISIHDMTYGFSIRCFKD